MGREVASMERAVARGLCVVWLCLVAVSAVHEDADSPTPLVDGGLVLLGEAKGSATAFYCTPKGESSPQYAYNDKNCASDGKVQLCGDSREDRAVHVRALAASEHEDVHRHGTQMLRAQTWLQQGGREGRVQGHARCHLPSSQVIWSLQALVLCVSVRKVVRQMQLGVQDDCEECDGPGGCEESHQEDEKDRHQGSEEGEKEEQKGCE